MLKGKVRRWPVTVFGQWHRGFTCDNCPLAALQINAGVGDNYDAKYSTKQ